VMGKDLTEVADADNIAREADLIIRVIKKKGQPLFEEEYDSETAQEDDDPVVPLLRNPDSSDRMKKSRARIRRISKRNARARKPKGAPPLPEDDTPRIGAELALILGGNRDGVLEAFTIHAIPGYNFQVIEENFSSEDVKKWVEEDNKKLASEEKGEQAKQFNSSTFQGTKEKTDRKNRKAGL